MDDSDSLTYRLTRLVVNNPKPRIQNRKGGVVALQEPQDAAWGHVGRPPVAAFAICAAVAEAQQTGKIFRIGYLDGSTVSGSGRTSNKMTRHQT